ncbi:MAG: prolyl oligopeptidase family serine peptidase [Bacteroidales bacterium]|nr:prolyl oligopeptidase family serine peptidase [Bacteroidales bacterium]
METVGGKFLPRVEDYQHHEHQRNGKPEDIPDIYEKATPTTYLHDAVPPFLILHGTEDAAVPIIQNDLFYEDLVQAGISADYYIIEGGWHGSPHFYQPEIKELILAFLNQHLAAK